MKTNLQSPHSRIESELRPGLDEQGRARLATHVIMRRAALDFAAMHKRLSLRKSLTLKQLWRGHPDDERRVERRLRRSLTLKQLWREYREAHPEGYGYSRYCELYREWEARRSPMTLHEQNAGSKLFVDYATNTVLVRDPNIDEDRPAQVFVAVLEASPWCYAEASWEQDEESRMGSHLRALEYFGDSPQVLVPGNLEPGAQLVKLKRSALEEALRQWRFKSIEDCNAAIQKLLKMINEPPFQKRAWPPQELFEENPDSRQVNDVDDQIDAKNCETQGSADTAHLLGPIQLVSKIFDTWKLRKNDGAKLLGLRTYDEVSIDRILSGKATDIRRDTRDRIAYLIQIRNALFSLFRDESVENQWLRERHEILDNHAPLDLLLEGSMENLLLVRDFCDEAGGI